MNPHIESQIKQFIETLIEPLTVQEAIDALEDVQFYARERQSEILEEFFDVAEETEFNLND